MGPSPFLVAWAIIPPSTTMVAPLMYVASSDARKAMVPATSSGWPCLPRGAMRISAACGTPSGSWNCERRGVSMPPGQMQLMRTPLRPNSAASARVSITTPPFKAQYAAL